MIHPLNCKEVTTRLALGDLGQYSWPDRLMIRFHLVLCWVCRKYERQMKVIGHAFEYSAVQKGCSLATPQFKENLINHLSRL